EQKVALVYRADEVSLDSARVILTDEDYAFAGRPPVAFHLSVTIDSATEHLIVVVMHAKAGSDAASRDRRDQAAAALKAFMDTTWPTRKVLVIGDFNDDVDTSITTGQPSPYRYFVADSAHYDFPTAALSAAGDASTVSYADVIDHQLDTNEAHADCVPGSAEVFRADHYIPDYGNTTSDHYPVIVRYRVVNGG
ncbi:MAG: endonuclease/exonuclease/phosphatase, partial [Gemmatimonadota bacterium]